MIIILYLEFLLVNIIFTLINGASFNLNTADFLQLVPSNIIFVAASPDERIFIHCYDSNFYEFHSNLTLKRIFNYYSLRFSSMTFYNNSHISLIRDDKKSYGGLDLDRTFPVIPPFGMTINPN